jgi:diguanylate cyclase (GGDEF)-like protein
MFDLDHFKCVNDRYGHLGGDEVLRVVARRVAAAIREIDTFGRYGGEEFAVVLPSTDLHGALVVAERIRRSVADELVDFDDDRIAATVSVGVAEATAVSASHLDLVEHADRALYASKAAGRNCVRIDAIPELLRLAG